ncbi:MAG: FtsX-like permease family protein [Anaeromicrobium sp.]|jgi:putative ABC transport system permease protein|uniref:ABC transporter permease n=1 Tax=Anaeromicrobium sp. TaxID=1929132 RepID=UPI0025EB3E33|nr:FtsX-like permease family protein [Anaeromicrobium sp.]MCT4594089.1 FtsX-like permease family protein [Anaeromicrobium sp.]
MKFKTIALNNIKKDFKKYIMYFLSLTFSVFTAYTFLALMENKSVLMAFTYDDRYKALLKSFGIIMLVFIVFFLIISNNSFIRARKKEISTYSLFGMSNYKITKLIFIETLIVGMGAIIVGIIMGIIFSKFMAMILINITIISYVGEVDFCVDFKSILITMGIFLGIFSIMGLGSSRVINKFQLVDLFKGDKISESKGKGSYTLLVISLLLIGSGYMLACNPRAYMVLKYSLLILILTISGTYLLFWAGLPKIINIMKKRKKTYYNGGNLIAINFFSHKVKSISTIMATIAILSAVGATAFSTGYVLYLNAGKNVYKTIGYDLYFYTGDNKIENKVDEVLKKHNKKIDKKVVAQRYVCSPKVENGEIISYGKYEDDYLRVYPESLFKKLMWASKHKNYKMIDLKAGEATFMAGYMGHEEEVFIGKRINFQDKEISIKNLMNFRFLDFGAFHTIILDDEDFNDLLERKEIRDRTEDGVLYDKAYVYSFEDSLESKKLNMDLKNVLEKNVGSYRTAYDFYDESLQSFGLVCFIGMFMGVVFALMTASLLYFKQLMLAEEEKKQYEILRKVGMCKSIESRVVSKRVMPVFLIPIIVGIIHSIFAMKSADTMVFSNLIGNSSSYGQVLFYSGVMYLVYGIINTLFYMITKNQYLRAIK